MSESARARHLRVKYGLSEDDYNFLFRSGGGVCWLCKEPPKAGKNLQVDHDHATMEVRGLLHPMCNKWLSYFWTPRKLRLAAAYLEGPYTGFFAPRKKRRRKKR